MRQVPSRFFYAFLTQAYLIFEGYEIYKRTIEFLPKVGDPAIDQVELTEAFTQSIIFKVPSLLIAIYGLLLTFMVNKSWFLKRAWLFILMSLFYFYKLGIASHQTY